MIGKIEIAVGVALLAIVLGLTAGMLHYKDKAEIAETKLTAAKDNLESCESANTANVESIAILEHVNKENREAAAAAKLLGDGALAAAADLSDKLRAAGVLEAKLRSQIYANDAAARAWGDVLIPAAVADRLRQRTAGDHAHADGNGVSGSIRGISRRIDAAGESGTLFAGPA